MSLVLFVHQEQTVNYENTVLFPVNITFEELLILEDVMQFGLNESFSC